MTPAEFRKVAVRIAGPHWRTRLGPMIGKCRTQVWEYATGKREVPEAVEKLMVLLSVEREGAGGSRWCPPRTSRRRSDGPKPPGTRRLRSGSR
jgi:hypothetical protein